MIEKQFLKSIFAGDNTAFTRLYKECRELFLAYFAKHFPGTRVSLIDLYQDSIMELWEQIVEGRITEEHLKCSLSTYIISIGINKMHEEYRGLQKQEKGQEKMLSDDDLYSLLTGGQERPSSFGVSCGTPKPIIPMNSGSELSEEKIKKLRFYESKYKELGYPCNILLRYTWYENMSDNDILIVFGGYFANTNSLKSKRCKCKNTLENMYNAWKISQNK